MRLSAQTIAKYCDHEWPMIIPFTATKMVQNGKSYGLSACGYDIRIAQRVVLQPHKFTLASTVEKFDLPTDIQMEIKDKSSWARVGLAVQNTVAEPGWIGHLTIELTNHSDDELVIEEGDPIAQVLFTRLDHHTNRPYEGKYQDQGRDPQPAIYETQEDMEL